MTEQRPIPKNRLETNRNWWNERAAAHRHTPLYQAHIQRLREGGLALLPLETREVGDLRGLRVLHSQCHIGTDTLSLARLGAEVTGVDFSETAIAEARQLSNDLGIPAHFEVLELEQVGERFPECFDRVFTSHGVLPWLPDLRSWATNLSACLKPGGRLYLSDSHPLVWALAEDQPRDGEVLRLGLPYLSQPEPFEFVEGGSYADRQLPTRHNRTVEWSWGLGDVVAAILGAGLELEFLREHPMGFYPVVEGMVAEDDGHYRLPSPLHGRFPLTFSLQAHKPEAKTP